MNRLFTMISQDELLRGETPINFVGVHPLHWRDNSGKPTAGFVELEDEDLETIEWGLRLAIGNLFSNACVARMKRNDREADRLSAEHQRALETYKRVIGKGLTNE